MMSKVADILVIQSNELQICPLIECLVTRKFVIKVLFNDFIEKDKIRSNVFFVIMKGVPIITYFKRPLYQAFN